MAITNATLATKINDLIDFWDSFRQEYENWLGGVVGGGPSSDGKYPLTDYVGTVQTIASPAQLQDDVDNIVTGATAAKNAAEAAQTAAELAETNAETAETNAETAETGSVTAKDAALAAQTAAESARTTAIAQAAAALASATAAAADAVLTAADVVSTNADVVLTNADVVLTGIDVAAAAASAAAAAADAAAIDLPNVAHINVNETITGQYTFHNATTVIQPNAATDEGFQFLQSANLTIIRPRDNAGTAWDFLNDFLYDTNSTRWQFDKEVRFQNGPLTFGPGVLLAGIDVANLLDKSDAETITGAWDFTTTPKISGTNIVSDAPSDGSEYSRKDAAWVVNTHPAEVNDLSAAVVWANVPIANIPAVALRHVSAGYNSGDVSVAATAPSTPAQGDIWFDTAATIPLDYEQLDDVTITSIASGEIAKWNGTAWINNTLAEAGIAATAHTHDSIVDTNLLDKSAAETVSGVYTFSAAANFTAAPTKSALGIPYYITATYTGGKITVASTAPSSPAKGDLWFDTT